MYQQIFFTILTFLASISLANAPSPLENPTKELNIHLVGVHPEKGNPSHQAVAHHFCQQVNEDFAQCALYDGASKSSNLMGIEYIISEKTYDSLPAIEKQYWHPHNYEILSGALSAPTLPAETEKGALKGKMNSYGKTWHVWRTPNCCNGTRLPLGPPTLQWSLNHDGEANADALQKVQALGINMDEKRKHRADLASLAKPQGGVDALKPKFNKNALKEMTGISEKTARK